jgi:quinol monooxygenase YgiN/ketosteroid isomerase-like protein
VGDARPNRVIAAASDARRGHAQETVGLPWRMHLTRRDLLAAGGLLMSSGTGAIGAFGQADGFYGLIGKMTALPGRRDDLIAILLGGVAGMPGCLSYVVARDGADADAIWITEVWDSAASHTASLSLPSVRDAIAKGRPLIAGFGISTVTTPTGGHGLVVPRPTSAEAEVRATLALFLTAFENLDWDRFRQCFDDDATVFFPAPSPPQRHDGRTAVEAGFADVFARIRKAAPSGPPFQRLPPEDLNVEMVNAEVAVATFHLRGADRLARRTVVMGRRGALWRIVHMHATNVPNK